MYKYMSLEVSMEIVEYGQTELRDVRNRIDVPIAYKLEREQYTLFALVDKHTYRPVMIFSIESEDIPDAKLVGTSIWCSGMFMKVRKHQVQKYGYPENGLSFLWSPTFDGPCKNAVIPTGDDRKVEISIYNGSDKLVAVERLRFEIKGGGIYREYHSL